MSDKILKLDQAQTLYQDLRERIDALPTNEDITVTDVQVNGTSVLNNGVANVPIAEIPSGSVESNLGVVKVRNGYDGLRLNNSGSSPGRLSLHPTSSTQIKAGNDGYLAVTTLRQHESTFYGLAKAAGADMKDIANTTVGTYPGAQKAAIQSMLGVSDLIAPTEDPALASKAYSIDDVFTTNGKLYKVISSIAIGDAIVLQNEGETVTGANAVECKVTDYAVHDVQVNGTSVVTDGVANVPIATSTTLGVVMASDGLQMSSAQNGKIMLAPASSTQIKGGIKVNVTNDISKQHESTFYGLAKAAGDTTQSASSNAVGTYTDEAKTAIRTMLGAVGTEDYATANDYGIVKLGGGLTIDGNGLTVTDYANSSVIKTGAGNRRPITPAFQHESVFYGLAAAAGDTTQKTASTFVGTYTDNAKASIKAMLGIQDGSTGTVDVTGATPTITAVENTRYVCGEVTSLSFTPPASGISIVRFTSGSSVTVLTIPSTVKFPEWFDPTSLETNTIYEICVTDGVYGAVMSWAL